MPVEQNIKLMRRWFQEVWNEGKTQTIYDLLAPDGIGIGQLENGAALRGPAEFAALVGSENVFDLDVDVWKSGTQAIDQRQSA